MTDDERDDDVLLEAVWIVGVEHLVARLPVDDPSMLEMEVLERLGVEQIDYYLLHALDGNSWDKLTEHGVIDFLNSALADGRIRNTGFSFHGSSNDFQRIVDAYEKGGLD